MAEEEKRSIWGKVLALSVGYVFAELLVAGLNLISIIEIMKRYEGKKESYSYKHQLFYDLQKRDDDLGFVNVPNLNEKYTYFGLDFLYNTDEKGFRNKHLKHKESQISVLGDSFAYSFGVNFDDSWPKIVEDKLEINVSNFGVISYAPWQYNGVMKRFSDYFRNKTILYCIYTNDFVAESPSIASSYYEETGRDGFSSIRPSFTELVSANTVRKPFLEKTAVYQLYHRLILGSDVTTIFDDRYLVRDENEMKDAWLSDINRSKLFDVFGEAVDISKEYNSTMIVVLFPSRARIYKKYYESAFSDEESIPLEEKAYDLTKQYFTQRGTEVIDLTDVIKREVIRGTHVYFKFDAHLNEYGNEVVACNISKFLIKHNYVEPTKTTTEICKEKPALNLLITSGIVNIDEIDF